ncbi:MAG: hypothetical protein IBJ12_11130 [Sphingomonadaceae bacterium]|nr:hypothetical protein [Sphingomonadaceae bacterium]
MRKKTLKFGFALFIACQASQLAAQTPPTDFDFAKAKIGDWSVKAETEVLWSIDQGKLLPRVENVNCYGQSADADLSLNSAMQLNLFIRFRGPGEDGDIGEITLIGDHLWLYVDGERWEFANIERRPSALLNVSYPVNNDKDQIIIPVWRGFQAVRKTTKDSWKNFDLIQDKLLSAKKLAWSFKSRDWAVVNRELNELPKGWETSRYPIDNTHWRAVNEWCSRQIASDSARTLPTDLLKYTEQ